MTAAVVVLAIALLTTSGGLVALALFLRQSLTNERTSLAAEALAEHIKDVAESQRDEAMAHAAQLQAELEQTRAQLTAAETQRNAATAQEADHVAETIAASPTALDALHELNRGLFTPVSGALDRGSPAGAGADHSDARAPAVHPATGADPAAAGGHPSGR